MQQVLLQNGVPPEAFSPVCVIVDKLDKIGAEKVMAPTFAACRVPLLSRCAEATFCTLLAWRMM